jgi:rubredoxin
LEKCKDLQYTETSVKILSAMNEENREQIATLAKELCGAEKKTAEEENVTQRKYVCQICGWIYDEAVGLPEQGIPAGTKIADLPDTFQCEICRTGKENFKVE